LLPAAQRALASMEECTRSVSVAGALPAMDVVLGTRHELGLSWIMPHVDELKELHPSVELHLYFGSGVDLVNRVRSMQIDCALPPSRLDDPKLEALRLHREDYVFIGTPALLDRIPFVKAEDAADHTLVEMDDELPLFRYWRDAPKGVPLTFGKLARF